jgi:CheY-like chemotaxis protein
VATPIPVLIVDDNPLNAKLTKLLLERHGYVVETTADARQTFETLKRFAPRLILMDLQMPDMDGLELTRRLKRDPQMKEVVIVALTAYAMKGDDRRAIEAGCDGYVTKPVDTRTLPVLVADFLRRKTGQ